MTSRFTMMTQRLPKRTTSWILSSYKKETLVGRGIVQNDSKHALLESSPLPHSVPTKSFEQTDEPESSF